MTKLDNPGYLIEQVQFYNMFAGVALYVSLCFCLPARLPICLFVYVYYVFFK